MRGTASRTIRAIPTLLRIGVAETVAYRAEFLVWILTMTMPLVMLGLWTSVAGEAPFKSYTSSDFVAYYLSTMIVRNLTGSWVAWQISEEIRMGTMSMRLLRPIHPFVAFGASHLAAIPFRSVIAIPFAVALLASSGADSMTHDPVQLALVLPSIALAWLITFALLYAIGSLAFFVTSTMGIANIYFGVFSLTSGYLIPLPLLPSVISNVAAYTPFPAMLATPVEMITKPCSAEHLAHLFGVQAGWAAASVALALGLWKVGVRRFEAVGA